MYRRRLFSAYFIMRLRDFLYLNRSDRNSVIILLLLVIIALGLVIFYGDDNDSSVSDMPTKERDVLIRPKDKRYVRNKSQSSADIPIDCGEHQEIVLKTFDPNTADSTTLLGLGLSRWQVRNIYKYRAHGGVYRTKEDFAHIYGLTVKQYHTIEPFISISDDYKEASTLFDDDEERDTLKYPIKIKEGEHVFLNLSDTSQLKKVPGIGSAYARAIVSYGERLGGYVDVTQLMEIDGFPEESLQYFEVGDGKVTKLNINRLSVSKMQRHPYITFFMARTIADYRRLNGPLTSLSQLKLDKNFPPEVIERLSPYVEY